ncbi:MAG: hypothetical protein Q9178_001632 [Gyalolechia marmorata]
MFTWPPFVLVALTGQSTQTLNSVLQKAPDGSTVNSWWWYLVATLDYRAAPQRDPEYKTLGTQAPIDPSSPSPFVGKSLEDVAQWLRGKPQSVYLDARFFGVLDKQTAKSGKVAVCRLNDPKVEEEAAWCISKTAEEKLLSEQQLSGLIPPSLRYLLAVATHRRPRYLLRVLNSFDEIYALLMLAVERHYLRTYGGGFTENFYGLKRERVLRIKGGEAPRASKGAPTLMRETLRLKETDIWNNLAIMVALPYFKRKLDENYDIHVPQASILGPQYNRNTLVPNATIRERLIYYYTWFLRNIYPSINAAYYFSLLAFHLAYLFDNTKYFSPFLWLIGTRIRRMGEADYRAIALAEQTPPNLPSRSASRPRPSTSDYIGHADPEASTLGF